MDLCLHICWIILKKLRVSSFDAVSFQVKNYVFFFFFKNEKTTPLIFQEKTYERCCKTNSNFTKLYKDSAPVHYFTLKVRSAVVISYP